MKTFPLSRRRATLATLMVASAVMGTGWALAAPTADARTPASRLADSVAASLRAARAGGAASRAPLSLAFAEDDYAAGLLEQRRQELRMAWRRDYRAARETLARARDLADAAVRVSRDAANRENVSATAAVAWAQSVLSPLVGAEEQVWMPPSVRHRLQRARTMVAEGSSLLAEDAYTLAAGRARQGSAEAQAVSVALLETTARYADDENVERWRKWAADAVEWSRRTGKSAIVVDKDAHLVSLYRAGRLVRAFDAELGWNNVGDKRHQGDGATPEGHYKVVQMKGQGRSRYHKALLLDYPNAEDLRNLDALKASGAVTRSTRAGGLIEIHGEGGRGKDWTDGCIAVTNAQMDELFKLVGVGTPVTVVGSRAGQGVFSNLARKLQP